MGFIKNFLEKRKYKTRKTEGRTEYLNPVTSTWESWETIAPDSGSWFDSTSSGSDCGGGCDCGGDGGGGGGD